jgi:hypothetical protein
VWGGRARGRACGATRRGGTNPVTNLWATLWRGRRGDLRGGQSVARCGAALWLTPSRPDRKATAKMLAAKGLSTRQIAGITGWSKTAIARDLAVPNGTKTVPNGTETLPADPDSAADPDRAANDERAAEAGAPSARPASCRQSWKPQILPATTSAASLGDVFLTFFALLTLP